MGWNMGRAAAVLSSVGAGSLGLRGLLSPAQAHLQGGKAATRSPQLATSQRPTRGGKARPIGV